MSWSLTQTVAPVSEPVRLDQLKKQARIDVDLTEEDEVLGLYLQAARQAVENETGRQLLRATWVYRASCFPRCGALTLPNPPTISVSSVVYIDGAGATQTWASSNYLVDTASDTDQLSLAPTSSWPSVRTQANAVTITYLAGYASPAVVPAPLKMAMLLWAAEMYKNREPTGDKEAHIMPYGLDRFLYGYRLPALMVG